MNNWKTVLWREWHRCDDKDYARRLYHVIAVGSFNWVNRLITRRQPRPYAGQVEAALNEVVEFRWGGKFVWAKNLRRLEQAKAKSTPISDLMAELDHHHWLRRFIARHTLLHRGGEAMIFLKATAQDPNSAMHQTAKWLIESIGAETTDRLAKSAGSWLCPDCLVRAGSHAVDRDWRPDLTYYGCRACGRSSGLLPCPVGVKAVLDSASWDRIREENGLVSANWLHHPAMFDFDEVEIVLASDEEVERFAVQAGNDTDPDRVSHYGDMLCHIGPQCRLSLNTVRVLERMFGQVTQANGA